MSDSDPILAGMNFLVLDDEPLLAFSMCDRLHFYGAASAEACTTLTDAQRHLDSGKAIDCALLDIQIGRQEVWPVAQRLKDRGIPFVFVSATCGTRPLPAGFDDHHCVSKPVDPLRLREAILRCLNKNK